MLDGITYFDGDGLGFTGPLPGLDLPSGGGGFGSGIDWGSIITTGIQSAPGIIGAAKGQPPYAYPGYAPPGSYAAETGGQRITGGVTGPGGSLFGSLDMNEMLKWGVILLVGVVVLKKVMK